MARNRYGPKPTPEQLLQALERVAGQAGPVANADLNLLALEAARVGLRTLAMACFGLTRYHNLNDVGFGFDAIAEALRGAPLCPKLREVAREVTGKADGDAAAAGLHYRRIMAKYARNHAKALLEQIDKGLHHLQRNIRNAIPRSMQRGSRMFLLPARAELQPLLPSAEHVEELRLRCGAGESRVPHLVAATRAVLHEHPEHAPWLPIRQLASDYLVIMTLGNTLPTEDTPAHDGRGHDATHRRMLLQRMLQHLEAGGFETLRVEFLRTTSLSPDLASSAWDAFRAYQQALFRGEITPGDRADVVTERMNGVTRAVFREQYRPALDRLQDKVFELLQERFHWDGEFLGPEGGDEA